MATARVVPSQTHRHREQQQQRTLNLPLNGGSYEQRSSAAAGQRAPSAAARYSSVFTPSPLQSPAASSELIGRHGRNVVHHSYQSDLSRLVTYDGKFSARADRVCRKLGLTLSTKDREERSAKSGQHATVLQSQCKCRTLLSSESDGRLLSSSYRAAAAASSSDTSNGGLSLLHSAMPTAAAARATTSSCLFTHDCRHLVTARLCSAQDEREHIIAVPVAGALSSSSPTTTEAGRYGNSDSTASSTSGHTCLAAERRRNNVQLATLDVDRDGDGHALEASPLLVATAEGCISYIGRNTHIVMPLQISNDAPQNGQQQHHLRRHPTQHRYGYGRHAAKKQRTMAYIGEIREQSFDDAPTPPAPVSQAATGRPSPEQLTRLCWRSVDPHGRLMLLLESNSTNCNPTSVTVLSLLDGKRLLSLDDKSVPVLRSSMFTDAAKQRPRLARSKQQVQPAMLGASLSTFTSATFSPDSKQLLVAMHSFFIPHGGEECSVFSIDLNRPTVGGDKKPLKLSSPTNAVARHLTATDFRAVQPLCVRTPDAQTSVRHVCCVYHPAYAMRSNIYALPASGAMTTKSETAARGRHSYPWDKSKSLSRTTSTLSSPIARHRQIRRRSSFSDVEATSASLIGQEQGRQLAGSIAVLSIMETRKVLEPVHQWRRVMLLHADTDTVLWERVRRVTGHQSHTVQLEFSPDGSTLALLLEFAKVELLSTSDGSVLHTLLPAKENNLSSLGSVVFSSDQRYIAGVINSKDICLWSGSVATLKHLSCLAVNRLRDEMRQRKKQSRSPAAVRAQPCGGAGGR
eukprot:scpid29786/ scgid22899/ 